MVSNVYGTNKKSEFITVVAKGKKSPVVAQRKSSRKSNTDKIKNNVEAAKKKQNEIPGNISSFAVFNTISSSHLERVASTSNIDLEDSEQTVEENITVMQAQETARALVLAAKEKIEEGKYQMIEGVKEKEAVEKDSDTN